MKIFTIGFTKKNAEQFFEPLKENGIQLLIDVRLNNRSQLAGFTKDGDLQYFLKQIGNIEYVHCEEFSPSKELLKGYQDGSITWEEYEKQFATIMKKRGCCDKFISRFGNYEKVCLLCSEATPEHCHRRLVAETIKEKEGNNIEIIHI